MGLDLELLLQYKYRTAGTGRPRLPGGRETGAALAMLERDQYREVYARPCARAGHKQP
jgi:hypothetical protein